jgi:hypothetical protein
LAREFACDLGGSAAGTTAGVEDEIAAVDMADLSRNSGIFRAILSDLVVIGTPLPNFSANQNPS